MKPEPKIYQRTHFHLYEEILKGKFRPFLPKFKNPENLDRLFVDAQTLKLYFPYNILNDMPLMKEYGFKSPEHYTYTINNEKKPGEWELILTPVKRYRLRENIQIPVYPTTKARDFSLLICDEFERMKIKAEYALEILESRSKAELYAMKNVNKAKKLHHDARILMNSLQNENDTESVFIIFVLDYFIIQSICFLQKLFKSFIPEPIESEFELKTDLFNSAFSKHSGFITGEWDEKKSTPVSQDFQKKSAVTYSESGQKKSTPCYQGFQKNDPATSCESDAKKVHARQQGVSEYHTDNQDTQDRVSDFSGDAYGAPSESHANSGRTFLPVPPTFQKTRITTQINVLCDVVEYLTQPKADGKKPLHPVPYEDLPQYIFDRYLDKHGNEISMNTLKTILRRSRSVKKIHPDSPKRIDLSTVINKKKVR